MKRLTVTTMKVYLIPDSCRVVRREGIPLLQTETGELMDFYTVPSKISIYKSPPPLKGNHFSLEQLDEETTEKWDEKTVAIDGSLKIGKPSKDQLWCYRINTE
jgi:hypothetical protein